MKTQFNIQLALEEALSFQKSGLTTQAKEIYQDILKEDDKNFEAYFELGNCFKKLNDYNNALLYLKIALKVNNRCYICHYEMAKIYDKLGKYEFAIFHLEKVMDICPDFYEAFFSMAQCYRKMKDEENMLTYLNKTLAKMPNHPGANHLFASLHKETSSEYSSEYAQELFDRYADHFEEHLLSSLNYQVPFIIQEKLQSLDLAKNSKVLDLGCGTGILGKTIIDQFPNIVGVDISSNMIKETRKKEIYTTLHTNDIHDFLLKNEEQFDLIIAADVFIYIGNIQTIFTDIKKCLSSEGYFIFTIELSSEIHIKDFQLGKSGRFSHDIEYIESLCNVEGFEIVEKEEIILREENKIGQKGAIFTLRILS